MADRADGPTEQKERCGEEEDEDGDPRRPHRGIVTQSIGKFGLVNQGSSVGRFCLMERFDKDGRFNKGMRWHCSQSQAASPVVICLNNVPNSRYAIKKPVMTIAVGERRLKSGMNDELCPQGLVIAAAGGASVPRPPARVMQRLRTGVTAPN